MDEQILLDLLIVGAGPMGLAAACAAEKAGITYAVLDKAGLCQTIADFAPRQSFYSPADELTIGGVPFPIAMDERPRREDVLAYYRAVVESLKLNLHTWERVVNVALTRSDGLAVESCQEPDHAWRRSYAPQAILLAHGVWDTPRRLENVPGANLRKVTARYIDPTPYYGKDCVVIGGGNSAAEVAIALARAGARVTMVMIEGSWAECSIRPFVMRELSIMVDEKQLQVRYSTHVSVIEPTEITLNGPDGEETVPNDFVFAMIGNVPDVHFLRRAGIDVDPGDKKPVYDPETFETNVPGIYVVGSLTREPHIFNGRLRAAKIVDHIVSELRGSKPR